jgi:uncharacterized protein with von Willebrand factor type A (vWA) domain
MLDPRLIETDSYDRDAFAREMRSQPGIEELTERGERLLPHFDALLADLFALLFKLVVRVRESGEAPASTELNRRLLLSVLQAEGLAELKEETALDASRAAHAACALARRALAVVKAGETLTEEELLAAKELAGEEERLERERAAARELEPSHALARQLEARVAKSEGRERELRSEVQRSLEELPPHLEAELAAAATRLAEKMPQLDEDAEGFARSMGAGNIRSAGERLRLAEKLEKSAKLRQLARLAGALRAEARAARRRRRERAASEVYRVGRGSDLGRLLPSELCALRHPLRRRDFLRRLHEDEIAQYDLRGDDRHGRGPMVVCLDGSGSMSGPRELWAKAVALALLDIARRQGRRTRALVFSGPEVEPVAFDLTRKAKHTGRRPVDLEAVVALAECFPGGGTDFEKPLRASLAAIREGSLKGADIVFITDGEANLSDTFVEELRREKRRRDIAILAVLVDDPSRNEVRGAGSRAAQELGKVADQLTTVTELTARSARTLFEAV